MPEDRPVTQFELRRQSDDLVYRFEKKTDQAGRSGFRRSDGEYWIIWRGDLGWIAGSWGSEDVFGRPWDQRAEQSEAFPPEGIWVSRKGPKAYVYDLVHVKTP